MDYIKVLTHWFERHGSSSYSDAEEWINSMSNVELLETLEWSEWYAERYNLLP